MRILEAIIRQKEKEVIERQERMTIKEIKERTRPEMRDFTYALQQPGVSIIAELKRKSPSGGIIAPVCQPALKAQQYSQGDARAISVLTDETFFGGMLTDIKSIKDVVGLPVLRKEFIIHEYQIYESRMIGADAILLIASIITTEQLASFVRLAAALGMASLVEVHTAEEIERVLTTSAHIIGVNNRDLNTLEVDIDTALRLRPLIPDGYITVAESGIRTRVDVRDLEKAGFDGVLVGESLMRSENAALMLMELQGRSR